jgi:hypothetical protein
MLHRLIAALPSDVVPNPTPVQPPGMDGASTLLNWISWGVLMVAIAGFIVSLGVIVTGAVQGREMHGMKGLIVSLLVCIALGGVGTLIRTFV